jgi:broad specificity phosphatase PhoE
MKLRFLFILAGCLVAAVPALAQEKLTTIILLRHAEKVNDGSKNPDLTDQGKKRAEELVSFFKETPLQAVYSTGFIRTRETVAPLARAKSLDIVEYEAFKPEVIDKIVKDFQGGTVLICGHSNNIPWIANYLTGTEKFRNFDDNDYDNILIVTVAGKGKETSVTWLRN